MRKSMQKMMKQMEKSSQKQKEGVAQTAASLKPISNVELKTTIDKLRK
mgnify:CR=1 FL=1